MKRTILSTLLAIGSAGIAPAALASTSNGNQKFKIMVQNVTADNVLSPFFVYVLPRGASLFEVGKPASAGLAQLAETGNTATLEEEFTNRSDVVATAKASGPAFSGESQTVEITLSRQQIYQGATLHVVAMIGKSNDSFIWSKAISLATAAKYGGIVTNAINLDAGSEENTGNTGDFGPGGHPTDLAEGKVSYDRGLNPRGDAPDIIAWGNIAATVRVVPSH